MRKKLSLFEVRVLAGVGMVAAVAAMIAAVKVGGWFWPLTLLLWPAAAYLAVRAGDLVQGRADE